MTAPSASGEVIRGLTLTTNYGSSSRDWRWCQHVVANLFISLVDPPKLLQFFSSFTFCLPERQQGIPPIQMITFRCLLTNLFLHEHPNQCVQLKWSKGLRIGMMGFTWWQGKEKKSHQRTTSTRASSCQPINAWLYCSRPAYYSLRL